MIAIVIVLEVFLGQYYCCVLLLPPPPPPPVPLPRPLLLVRRLRLRLLHLLLFPAVVEVLRRAARGQQRHHLVSAAVARWADASLLAQSLLVG